MAVLNPYNYSRPKGVFSQKQMKRKTSETRKVNQNNAYNSDQYLEQKINTASPQQLTLMLYEGAIKFIKQAKIYNDSDDIEKTSNAILRVSAIYTELRATLDTDYEISEEFDRLYEYILHRLAEANIQKDNLILDEVLSLSEEFRETWKEAMEEANV